MKTYVIPFLAVCIVNAFFISEADAVDSLPSNCNEEEVEGTLPAGMNADQCHRIICGGNWWGDSAVDTCCGPESVEETAEGPIHYRTCQTRNPTTVDSVERWTETRQIFESPAIPLHDHEPPSVNEPVSWLDWVGDALIPVLVAQEQDRRTPWSQAERLAVADVAHLVGERILQALYINDESKVGPADSEYRAYIHLTLQSVLYTACALNPAYACPPELSLLHTLVPNMGLFWRLEGSLAETPSIHEMFVRTNLMIQTREGTPFPGNEGIVFLHGGWLIPHEMTHAINSFAGRFGNIGWQDFMNESLSRVVGALAYTFLTAEEMNALPGAVAAAGIESGMTANLLMSGNSAEARRVFMYEPGNFGYACDGFYADVGQFEQMRLSFEEWFNDFVEGRDGDLIQPEEACRRWFREDHPARLLSVLQIFEDQFQEAGGICSVWENSGGEVIAGAVDSTGALLCMSRDPDNHDNCNESSAVTNCPGEDPNATPPDQDFDPPNAADIDGSENDPRWTDPRNEVPSCVIDYSTRPAGSSSDRSCYQYCWDHRQALGSSLCAPLIEDDLRNNCTYSGAVSCQQETERRQVENELSTCRNSPFRSNGTTPAGNCLDFCEDPAHQSEAFCSTLCDRVNSHPFCDELCLLSDGTQWFCRAQCADNPGQSFCPSVCRSNPDYYGCEAVCQRQPEFCTDFCAQHRSFSYCQVPGDTSGSGSGGGTPEEICSSGWAYRRGSVAVARDGCFPFVGNIKCCGITCEPNGSNEACSEGGWCGCDPDSNADWSAYDCLRPSDSYTWDHDMQPPTGDAIEFYAGTQTCSRGVGSYSGECLCGGGSLILCYSYTAGGYDTPYRGLCCNESGFCVTRASLGLQP